MDLPCMKQGKIFDRCREPPTHHRIVSSTLHTRDRWSGVELNSRCEGAVVAQQRMSRLQQFCPIRPLKLEQAADGDDP